MLASLKELTIPIMNTSKKLCLVATALLVVATPGWAHHGSGISYDVANQWTTWATVTEFNYLNPHPTMRFERTTKDGKVEQWVSELLAAPAQMARAGWTRNRSNEALKPGTRVKLYLATSRIGGFSAIVMRIENEKGEGLATGVGAVNQNAVDLDGVPGGLQPKEKAKE
jgi:uncharacterized protein DUF6152